LADMRNRFIRERFERIRSDCAECDVVGVCRGGCILSGLDEANRLNLAACTYQRTLWRRMLAYANRRRRRAASGAVTAVEAPTA
jgi:sulfatase maturation enzyme AslB (radical SAM superfamily)